MPDNTRWYAPATADLPRCCCTASHGADGLATALNDPCRRAEFDDLGLVRMLSPEQLERKVGAVFGEKWNRLNGELAMLYGSIDSKEVTDRATDPRLLAGGRTCRRLS